MEDSIEIEISETNRGNEQIIINKSTNLIFHFKGKINQKFIDALNIKL